MTGTEFERLVSVAKGVTPTTDMVDAADDLIHWFRSARVEELEDRILELEGQLDREEEDSTKDQKEAWAKVNQLEERVEELESTVPICSSCLRDVREPILCRACAPARRTA